MNKKNKDMILRIQEICVKVDNALFTQEEIIEAAIWELIHTNCKFSILDVEPQVPYFTKQYQVDKNE